MSKKKAVYAPKESPFLTGGRLTLYGRKPVLEALSNLKVTPQKLFISIQAQGDLIKEIKRTAKEIGVPVQRCSAQELSRISKQGRQDQGVALDVQAPLLSSLKEGLDTVKHSNSDFDPLLFLVDGIQNPSNLGLLIRTLCATSLTALIVPKSKNTPLNPLVIKASAGFAFKAPIWQIDHALNAAQILKQQGYTLCGLRGYDADDLYEWSQQRLQDFTHHPQPQKRVWVLGNETDGISRELEPLIDTWISLPMSRQVESLNVAIAGSIVAYELFRIARLCTPNSLN
jgi:23S rRNA (guanosine2251-2'-O)-methyltransferase